MRIVKDQTSFTTRTGESTFVSRHFTPWNVIYADCKYIIPYRIDTKIDNNYRGKIALKTAFDKLESNSSLKFIEQTDQERYLYFTDGNVCQSVVGQQEESGPQNITLASGCLKYWTIIHEVNMFCANFTFLSAFTA